jgi:hypothetical protein
MLLLPGHERHPVAVGEKPADDREADAACTSGHQRDGVSIAARLSGFKLRS